MKYLAYIETIVLLALMEMRFLLTCLKPRASAVFLYQIFISYAPAADFLAELKTNQTKPDLVSWAKKRFSKRVLYADTFQVSAERFCHVTRTFRYNCPRIFIRFMGYIVNEEVGGRGEGSLCTPQSQFKLHFYYILLLNGFWDEHFFFLHCQDRMGELGYFFHLLGTDLIY